MLGFLVFHKILPENDGDRFTVTHEEFLRIVNAARAHAACVDPGAIADSAPENGSRSLILTFDDGTLDHCRLCELEVRMKGIFFVNSDNIGKKGYMGKNEIRALGEAGHTVGSHSHTHRLLTGLQGDEISAEVAQSVKILEDITGKKTEWFAPPEGDFDERVLDAARQAGIRYFRTTNFGWNRTHPESKGMRSLNTFNIGKHFQSRQLGAIMTSNSSYIGYCMAYRAKNLVKKCFPGLYRKIRSLPAK